MISHHKRHFKLLVLLTVVLSGLSACTSGLLARNLDWLVERYIDSYFDISDSQSELLSELVDDSTQRSADNSIPAVLNLLDTVIELNTSDELPAAIPDLAEKFEALGDRFSEDHRHNLIQFALTISAEQRSQISEELQHKNAKYAKKHVDPGPEARRRNFAKEAERNTRRWLGRLNGEQHAALEYYVQQYRLDEAQWLESRKAWQKEFLMALALRDRAVKIQRLSTLIDDPETTFPKSQRTDSEYNTELSIRLLQSIIGASTKNQRERMQKQLIKLRKRVIGFQQAIGYSTLQLKPGLYAFTPT